jgi:hypothetical protein
LPHRRMVARVHAVRVKFCLMADASNFQKFCRAFVLNLQQNRASARTGLSRLAC